MKRFHAAGTLVLLLARIAHALTCTVTNTSDALTPAPGSLRACIQLTNATPGKDTVVFDATVFNPGTIVLADEMDYVTDPAGTIIDGADPTQVIIDGAAITEGRALRFSSANNELRNVTVQNTGGTGSDEGAGVYATSPADGFIVSGVHAINNQGAGLFVLVPTRTEVHLLNNVIAGNGSQCLQVEEDTVPDGGCTGTRSTISGNTCTNNGGLTSDPGLVLEGFECADVTDNTVSGGVKTSLKLTVLATANRLLHNHIHDGLGNGIGVYAGSHDNEIGFNFVIHMTSFGIEIGDPGSTGNRVVANVFARTTTPDDAAGLSIYPGADGTHIYNNTFADNAGSGLEINGAVAGLIVRNNLSYGNATYGYIDEGAVGPTYDHNLGFANGTQDFNGLSDDIVCDPLLSSPGLPNDDYSLSTCASCAVDRGVDLGAEQPDLTLGSGIASYWGPAPDLGALESSCGRPDAGTADGGVTDGGASSDGGFGSDGGPPPSGPLRVACGCSSDAGTACWALGALGALRHRRQRVKGRASSLSRAPPKS